MTDDVCTRFAEIPNDAPLRIRSISVATPADEIEEWIALDVGGERFYAIPREGFLAGFHHAVHELLDDEDPPA